MAPNNSHPQPPYPLHESIVDRIDPQYADFYNKHIINLQQVHFKPHQESRTSGLLIPGAGPLQTVASTVDYTFPRVESQGPDVQVRIFSPLGDKPEAGWPVCVYFHGGGWVLGNVDTENVIASHLCARAKMVVVAVDYRLAPENPFPAAVDDAWEAALWVTDVQRKQLMQIDTTKLATAGSSAGANLAALVCQRSVARNTPWKVSLQLLSVPVMDNTATPETNPSWKEFEHAPALPAKKMLWFRNHYLPNKEDWTHPEASPLFWTGDWSKLPPACMVLGELDILKWEGEEFGRKLEEVGVRAEVNIMRKQPHPFIAMNGAIDEGARAITLFCEALEKAMYPAK